MQSHFLRTSAEPVYESIGTIQEPPPTMLEQKEGARRRPQHYAEPTTIIRPFYNTTRRFSSSFKTCMLAAFPASAFPENRKVCFSKRSRAHSVICSLTSNMKNHETSDVALFPAVSWILAIVVMLQVRYEDALGRTE